MNETQDCMLFDTLESPNDSFLFQKQNSSNFTNIQDIVPALSPFNISYQESKESNNNSNMTSEHAPIYDPSIAATAIQRIWKRKWFVFKNKRRKVGVKSLHDSYEKRCQSYIHRCDHVKDSNDILSNENNIQKSNDTNDNRLINLKHPKTNYDTHSRQIINISNDDSKHVLNCVNNSIFQYPNGVNAMTTRKEVVDFACKTALETWQREPITLNDSEIINLLIALDLIGSNGVLKNSFTHKDIKHESSIQYSLSLTNNTKELCSTLAKAWETIEYKQLKLQQQSLKNRYRYSSPIKRQKKAVPLVAAKMAKKYIIELMSIPDKVKLYLIQNEDICEYLYDEIVSLLGHIGIKDIPKYTRNKTLFDILKECLETTSSSILRRRLLITIDTIQFIKDWENAKKNDKRESIESQEKGPFGSIINELRASVAKLRDVIHKKDERIYLLTEELNKVKCRLISYQENNLPSKQYYGSKTHSPIEHPIEQVEFNTSKVVNKDLRKDPKLPSRNWMTEGFPTTSAPIRNNKLVHQKNFPFSMSIHVGSPQKKQHASTNNKLTVMEEYTQKKNSKTTNQPSKGTSSKKSKKLKMNTIAIAFQEEKEKENKSKCQRFETDPDFHFQSGTYYHHRSPSRYGIQKKEERRPQTAPMIENRTIKPLKNYGRFRTTRQRPRKAIEKEGERKMVWKGVISQNHYNDIRPKTIHNDEIITLSHIDSKACLKKRKEKLDDAHFLYSNDSNNFHHMLDSKIEERLQKINLSMTSSEAKLNHLLEKLRNKSMEKFARSAKDIDRDAKQRQNM